MASLKLLLISLLFVSMLGCTGDDAAPQVLQMGDCFTGKVIKSVKNQKGTVYYNANEKQYAVYVTIPGTYDSRDVGFICDKPETLKVDGLSVNFDGNYFAYEKDKKPQTGGEKYYYLAINDFEINKK
jgi:hypothetical protein